MCKSGRSIESIQVYLSTIGKATMRNTKKTAAKSANVSFAKSSIRLWCAHFEIYKKGDDTVNMPNTRSMG